MRLSRQQLMEVTIKELTSPLLTSVVRRLLFFRRTVQKISVK